MARSRRTAGTLAEPHYLSVFVPGRPAPQGSKRYVGRGISVESSKAVKPWRADIRDTLLARPAVDRAQWPLSGPLAVELGFTMPRPQSAPKRSTPAAVKRPDIDKLARAVLDAIGSAGVWADDAQVVDLRARKWLAPIGGTPGCGIEIWQAPDGS